MVEEIFIRALGRLPNEAEIAAFAEMNGDIQDDHREMVAELERAEEAWKARRVELEAIREEKLAEVVKKIEARTEAIKPERERLEKERQQRIAEAQKVAEEARAEIDAKIEKWSQDSSGLVEWYPLAANALSASNKAVLTPQADRSIVATGNKDKGVYTVTMKTHLAGITGFRLEALSDPSLPSNGPGLPANGNFVLTEFEVFVAPVDKPKEQTKVTIDSGVADFLQDGFDVKQTFNGQLRSQQGWAVAGATGVDHWATYKLKSPIENDGEILLTFKLHQFHNAAEHRLGKFRLSATTAGGEIPLGQPETFASILATPKQHRSEQAEKTLSDYVAATDAEIRKANEALAAAKKPVPTDSVLVSLEQRKKQLSEPTPDDPGLVQLREDVKQSTQQLQKVRLTAAEDLTWALINSPAFLFNR